MNNDSYTYPTDDYDEDLGYDANHNDPSQYCQHGTFIGSWWGPDYMCFYCETGEEPPTAEELHEAFVASARKEEAKFNKLVSNLQQSIGFQASVATWLVDAVATDVSGSLFRNAVRLYELDNPNG